MTWAKSLLSWANTAAGNASSKKVPSARFIGSISFFMVKAEKSIPIAFEEQNSEATDKSHHRLRLIARETASDDFLSLKGAVA